MIAVNQVAVRTACLSGLLILSSIVRAAGPTVSNVRARQVPGTGQVEVLYDLSGAPAGGATVSVAFSATGDAPYGITPDIGALSGDVGAGIGSGSDRRIVWDAGMTLASGAFGTTFTAAVTARDPGGGGDDITITLPGGVTMELVYIPAGTFMMGSPDDERGRWPYERLHQVTLTRGYYLGKYEVTQAQWEAVMADLPDLACGDSGSNVVGTDYPVYCVSWNMIAGPGGFVERLNSQLGGGAFRLPTGAEWERAARAETTTRFSHGDVLDCGDEKEPCPLHDSHMWWGGNNPPYLEQGYGAKAVGLKNANPYGLYDMHGNLWEWVQDWHDPYPNNPVTDPTGPESGTVRVIRGGSWGSSARYCRSANRYGWTGYPYKKGSGLGFRLARSE